MARELAELNPMFSYYIKTHGIQRACDIYKKISPKDPQYKVIIIVIQKEHRGHYQLMVEGCRKN